LALVEAVGDRTALIMLSLRKQNDSR